MSILQVVLPGDVTTTCTSQACNSVWGNSLVYPVYGAAILLILQGFISAGRRMAKIVRHDRNASHESFTATRSKAYIAWKSLSWFGILALTGLTAFAFVQSKNGSETQTDAFNRPRPYMQIELMQLALYCYLSVLGLITLLPSTHSIQWPGIHLNVIMLLIVSVYTYRDLVPLATYHMVPMDSEQGWLLWSRVAISSLVGVAIPLLTPRLYKPVDPLNPAKDVNTELTTSWFSFMLYSHLDPLIWKAAKTDHLPYEELPPLADYDYADYLVRSSKGTLDPYVRGKRTHLFFGLMKYFSGVYIQLALMITLRCLTGFIPPIAMKNLLDYLEQGPEASAYPPWVWVVLLFIGPNIGSIAFQYYIFLTTRMLVRTEGIITQLVFEHALRIRMKAESSQVQSNASSSVLTPDTQSIAEDADDESEASSTVNSGEETLRESSTSSSATATTTSSSPNARGKQKDTPPAVKVSETKSEGKKDNLIGKINNLVTTDLGNVVDGRDFLFLLLFSPVQFVVSVWLLYILLGFSAILGIVLSAVTLPLPGYIAKLMNKIQTDRMKKTDARVQTVTEIISVLRMTKLFGWENKVNKLIAEKRDDELLLIRKRKLINVLSNNLNYIIPLINMLATFASYTLVEKKALTAATVFSSLIVFEQLRNSLSRAFFMLPMLIDAKVSLSRVNDFLLNTELLDTFTRKEGNASASVDPAASMDSKVIGFRNASFTWSNNDGGIVSGRQYRLKINGELFFKPGELNLIVGPTGSGKTSLLMALLGEMHYEPNGEDAGFNLPRDGGVAYAAQEAWVQNETIKDNILFGKAYNETRYKKVIYQCGLERDLSLFEAGDSTEVGEKGLTLSGGQKARITLARAVYSDASILLLDDILAALDVHTSKFIVENCLQGDLLPGRTVILITHNVAMVAPIADFVVSLTLDGRIASQGTMADALKKNKKLVKEVVESEEVAVKDDENVDNKDPGKKAPGSGSKLIVAEEIALGHVSWRAMRMYLSSLGGISFWVIFLVSMLLAQTANSFQSWFLGYWAEQYNGQPAESVRVPFYLLMYGLILLAIAVLYSTGMATFALGSVKASRKVHQDLIKGVLGTTLRWLDTVPTARIITRCTQDIRAVDGPIADELSDTVDLSLYLLIRFLAVVFFVPVFLIPGIIVLILGTICGQLYMKAQLSVKREMSNRRSPVLAHFGAAISGLVSIRAYGAQEAFKSESLKRINGYIRPARTFYNCNRWVTIRIDAIGSAFSAGLAGYMVYNVGTRTASDSGFALSTAITLSQAILYWVRILNELEVQGNSLERIESYTNIDQEPKATESGKPPAYWPASGSLKVSKLCARYSWDGPEVLHSISFEVKSGERIGVVGRTGSGKSSLTLSLLRCIPTSGDVVFDGISTDAINLDALRSSITIIPQQPELLSGTLRENLDPFSEHSDATLNDALRAAGLFALQEEHDEARITLDSVISGGGNNLSVGQRQILALARAILRRSKILILDEATSAIDYATDSIIQTTLRETLKDATLITVAHRLQTIMDADKIMVLDAGNMVEFDSPVNLLKKEDGYLKSLVDQSGDKEMLYSMVLGQ
ncbi:hypothetical protein M422DRAFT_227467 [Sphaerobolus stellatus SS14]|uniref:P-loop containing nucleoside triphosphate hydrolase protein n=1 Tax=Sphaerobolus stellatus (strain SS14) TaxID=990650 RepID=A0A0C9US80_SPHS4|nr:hypothetical protein M422DRAFT_227467 [Sphaerobolus stellatus SS14]